MMARLIMLSIIFSITMLAQADGTSACGGSANEPCDKPCERRFYSNDGSSWCRQDPSCGACEASPVDFPNRPNTGNQSRLDNNEFNVKELLLVSKKTN